MTEPIKGVLIDPHSREIYSVDLPEDTDTEALARLIDARYFAGHTLRKPIEGDPGAILYVDENGPERPDQRFWSFDMRPEKVYAGKGLIAAIDVDGEMVYGVSTPVEITKRVVWRSLRYLGIEDVREGDVVHRFRRYEPVEEPANGSLSDRPVRKDGEGG